MLPVVKIRFTALYKDFFQSLDDLPVLPQFLLSWSGVLLIELILISGIVYLIFKELRVSRKKIAIIINIVAFIFFIILLFFYMGSLMLVVFTDATIAS